MLINLEKKERDLLVTELEETTIPRSGYSSHRECGKKAGMS